MVNILGLLGYTNLSAGDTSEFWALDLMDFSGGLVLPVPSLLQWPVECNCPGTGTIIHTAAAVPALFGMQYNRRFAFLGMGYIHVYLADFYTMVAAVADIRIENHRVARCSDIRNGDYFFLRHRSLQKSVPLNLFLNLSFPFIDTGVVFIMSFILLLHVAPVGHR
jgi:hypothetical protein